MPHASQNTQKHSVQKTSSFLRFWVFSLTCERVSDLESSGGTSRCSSSAVRVSAPSDISTRVCMRKRRATAQHATGVYAAAANSPGVPLICAGAVKRRPIRSRISDSAVFAGFARSVCSRAKLYYYLSGSCQSSRRRTLRRRYASLRVTQARRPPRRMRAAHDALTWRPTARWSPTRPSSARSSDARRGNRRRAQA